MLKTTPRHGAGLGGGVPSHEPNLAQSEVTGGSAEATVHCVSKLRPTSTIFCPGLIGLIVALGYGRFCGPLSSLAVARVHKHSDGIN